MPRTIHCARFSPAPLGNDTGTRERASRARAKVEKTESSAGRGGPLVRVNDRLRGEQLEIEVVQVSRTVGDGCPWRD